MAATALWCYSIATFAWSAQAVLARGFYSLQDTKTPVIITTTMVFVFTALCAILRVPLDYLGLALAASGVATLNMIAFLFTLQKKVGGLNLRSIVVSATKITAAALAGSAVSLVHRALAQRPSSCHPTEQRYHPYCRRNRRHRPLCRFLLPAPRPRTPHRPRNVPPS